MVISFLEHPVNWEVPMKQIENIIPVLPVINLKNAIRFYADYLSFQCEWGDGPDDKICSVSRDGHGFMLSEEPAGHSGTRVWMGLSSDSLFKECIEKGVKVLQSPRNKSWAYEMKLEDPFGNIIWFGTDPKTDVPFDTD